MFRRLRVKFILLSTGILILALMVVMGSVVGLLNAQILQQVYAISEMVIENGGSMPEDDTQFTTERTRERLQMFNPEVFYETRYFSVLIDREGNIYDINDDAIRFIKKSEMYDVAMDIYDSGNEKGTVRKEDGSSILAYQISRTEDNGAIIVFIDCTSRYWIVGVEFNYMCIVGAVVTLLFIILMTVFSKRLIRPYMENDQKQKSFITNASHELKTPLAVISANTEMIEALNGQSKWTDSTKRQIDRLNGLIAGMVTLARSAEKGKENLVKVDFSKIVKDVSNAFESVLISQGKQYNHDINAGISVKADQKTLSEVVNILVDNAVKYCDDGGIVMVILTREKLGRKVSLRISNTYEGHENVDYSKFFDRFYRADEAHNSKKSGYGIGLSIAKEAIERMGGKIKVSYLSDMITFTVIFSEAA